MSIKWTPVPKFDPSSSHSPPDTYKNARRVDPDTSHAATRRIRESDKAGVYAAFQDAGDVGLTDRELRAYCPHDILERQESWRKRRSDLARERVVEATESRRDRQIVWRLVPTLTTEPQARLEWD